MHLFDAKTLKKISDLDQMAEKNRKLRLEREQMEEIRKISDLQDSWEPQKKKLYDDFIEFQKTILKQKATLLKEVKELEDRKFLLS